MSIVNTKTIRGTSAAAALIRETRKQEMSVEAETGKPFKKGAARVDERSKSSDGKSAGSKQQSD